MQVLCDSIGDDFPTFPQFVAMLREYERQPKPAPIVAVAPVRTNTGPLYDPQNDCYRINGKWVGRRTIYAEPKKHREEIAALSRPRSAIARPILRLPNGSTYPCESMEIGRKLIAEAPDWKHATITMESYESCGLASQPHLSDTERHS